MLPVPAAAPASKKYPWSPAAICLAGAAFIVAYAAAATLLGNQVPLRGWAVLSAIPLLAAVVLVFFLVRNTPLGHTRTAWGYFGASGVLWLVERILQTTVLVGSQLSLAGQVLDDLILLGGYAAILAGFLTLLPPALRSYGRLRVSLDIFISGLALTSLFGLMLVRPVVIGIPTPSAQTLWEVAIPLANVFLLITFANGFLLLQSSNFRTGLVLLTAGIGCILISETLDAYWMLMGETDFPAVYTTGWAAGFTLLAVAAALLLRNPVSVTPGRPPGQSIPMLIQQVLPLASTVVLVWYAILLWQFGQQNDLRIPALAILCVLLLILRQGVAAGELDLQEYTLLVDSTAEPSFIYDRHGCLKLGNPALRSIGGFAESWLLSRSLADLFPAVDWKLGLARGGWSGETALRTARGEDIPVYLSLRPVLTAGSRKSAVAGTAHDLRVHWHQQQALQAAYDQVAAARQELVTLNAGLEAKVAEKTQSLSNALKRLEEQNRTLQTLDQLKTDFVSLVSHELRAPLTNVAGGIELVLSSPESLLPEVQETLSLVQREILRLGNFVESILDTSALDAGHVPVYPTPMSLIDFLHNLAGRWMSLRGIDNVAFSLPPVLPFIMADERALTSVFFHLIDNANKYAPGCGITISAWPDEARCYISVEDDGPGFSADGLSGIFGKFTRLQSADSQTVYGHGLGLYMTRRLLQAMRGDIQADNRPGGGARFIFWLPAIQEKYE